MVTKESPWDDIGRSEAEALYESEFLICKKCGLLREVCENPAIDYYPQRSTCYATVARDVAERRWAKKLQGGDPKAVEPEAKVGTHVWVSTMNLTPDDDFCD